MHALGTPLVIVDFCLLLGACQPGDEGQEDSLLSWSRVRLQFAYVGALRMEFLSDPYLPSHGDKTLQVMYRRVS